MTVTSWHDSIPMRFEDSFQSLAVQLNPKNDETTYRPAAQTDDATSVNQDRIICGLFEQIISNNRQITTALFAIICGLFVGYLRLFADYLSDYLRLFVGLFVGLFVIICRIILWLFAGYFSLFVDYLSII